MKKTVSKFSNTQEDIDATDAFNAFMVSKGAFAQNPDGTISLVPEKWCYVQKYMEEYKASLRKK